MIEKLAFGETITVSGETEFDPHRSIWTDLRNVAFTQDWIDVKGIRTRYLRAGNPDAPKLIMLHGTGGHSEVFAPNLGPFSEHYDCWAIDFVGHGYTDKPDVPYDSFFTAAYLKDFMDSAGIERADLVGISVGALHCLRLADTEPSRIGRMVLVTPFGAPMPEEGDITYEFWIGNEQPPRDGRDEAARNPSFEIARKILSGVVADIDKIPDDMVSARFDSARQPGAAEAYKHVMWWMDTDLRLKNTYRVEQLADIEHETLAFVGAGDPAFSPYASRMAAAMPKCAGVVIEGASHWANYESPQVFNELALSFLKDGAAS